MAQPKLLEQYRERLRVKHYSLRTEEAYLHRVRRFNYFHGKRHPRDMGGPVVEAFLLHLATEGRAAPSTQNQALAAVLFLYREFLQEERPCKNADLERREITVRDGNGGRGMTSPLDRLEPKAEP